MNVLEYLEQELLRDHVWGVTDCCSMVDRWIYQNTDKKISEHFGPGKYTSEKQAMEWLSKNGDMPRAFPRAMKNGGLKSTDKPIAGDVGLCVVGNLMCAALFDGHFWHSRNNDGFIGSKSYWKAWRVELCQQQ